MTSAVNWRQAFAEVGLILLGILLAVGADAWISYNQERTQEREHLMALRRDFLTTDSTFRADLQGVNEQYEHNRGFLQLLQGEPGSIRVDSLSRLVRKAFLWGDFVPVLATYQDLVNSGDLGLLRSDSLRTALAEFASFTEHIESYIDSPLRQWTDHVTPYFAEHFDITDLYGRKAAVVIADVVLPGIDMGPEIERIQSDESAFWSREFANLIAVRTVGLEDARIFVGRALQRVERILLLIEASLAGG